jgi:predicted short-subunit dehydrogenase-like oxidoreductase (DUF2520 family)
MHTVLLIGSGRLSRHLQYWNSLHENPLSLLNWNRKNHSSNELTELLKKADAIWLAISDSALSDFFSANLAGFKKPVVHFSGAFHDERMISVHPLMSFPEELMENSVYARVHFAVTGASSLQSVLPGFKNAFSVLPAEQKAFYHALCVMTGNFPQLLWSETAKEFQNLKIPSRAVETYIQQITTNFIQLKQAALTGPLVRKDFSTIEKNLHSLQKSKLKKIYEAFTGVFTL